MVRVAPFLDSRCIRIRPLPSLPFGKKTINALKKQEVIMAGYYHYHHHYYHY